MIDFSPKRIVCLTEETVETLYLIGEEDRIVGISGFTVRPKRARKEKPIVSLFTDASIDAILELEPDLVIGFSDIQADIAKELIQKGVNVWINNHRSVEEIIQMIVQLGAMVNKKEKAQELVEGYLLRIEEIKKIVSSWEVRPKIYFEEWYEPLISGIRWVSEIVEIAGGEDVFPEQAKESLAKNRIIEDQNAVIEKNPNIILASWCGKMFKKKRLIQRKDWDTIKAVKEDEIYEIDSSIILQPGPAALTDGLEAIFEIVSNWHKAR